GKSMYSVFSGSSLRHSSGFDAAMTSAGEGVLPGGGAGIAGAVADWQAASTSAHRAAPVVAMIFISPSAVSSGGRLRRIPASLNHQSKRRHSVRSSALLMAHNVDRGGLRSRAIEVR